MEEYLMTEYVIPENQSKIRAKFDEFEREHPEVYTELVKVSRRLLEQGWTKFGIATVFEVVRYKGMIRSRPSDGSPKLNNNHRALYARKIMEENPDLDGLFNLRKLGIPHHNKFPVAA
jgi:hypothetical protein